LQVFVPGEIVTFPAKPLEPVVLIGAAGLLPPHAAAKRTIDERRASRAITV
jgi:hypothetical protein